MRFFGIKKLLARLTIHEDHFFIFFFALIALVFVLIGCAFFHELRSHPLTFPFLLFRRVLAPS